MRRVAAVLLAFVGAQAALGQAIEATAQGDLQKSSTNPAIISAQLRAGLRHQQSALQYLQAQPTSESLQQAATTIYRAYAQIRLAHAGIRGRISKQKFPDPLLAHQEKWVQSVRSHLLTAMDQAKNADRLQQYGRIVEGVRHLHSAIALTERTLEVMP